VAAEDPQIRRLRDRMLRDGRHLVGIGHTFDPIGKQARNLLVTEPGEREVEPQALQLAKLEGQQLVIPFRPVR